jgi:hypothetical protein
VPVTKAELAAATRKAAIIEAQTDNLLIKMPGMNDKRKGES